jgi:hypothetical protein
VPCLVRGFGDGHPPWRLLGRAFVL